MSEVSYARSGDDLTPLNELAEMDGLEFISGMRDGRFPHPPIAETLDFRLTDVDRGHVVFSGRPAFAAYNPFGAAHGGWFGTLLDSCMACAVQTALPAGKAYTTVDYNVTILRPAFEDSPQLRAVGTLVNAGRRIATARGEMLDAEGRVYATGATTCLVFDLDTTRGTP